MNEQLASHYKPPKPAAYAALTIGIHLALSIGMRVLFMQAYTSNTATRYGICLWLTAVIPLFAVCRYYLWDRVPDQYREGGNFIWIRSFLRMVLPGEVIRMVISLPAFGTAPLGSFFSPFSWILTEKLYLYPRLLEATSSAEAVQITKTAFMVYPLFYVLYLALTYLPVLLIVYRIAWSRGQKQYEHLRQVYADHEADVQARDAMPDAAVQVSPEHKAKAFDLYNTVRGKRPKK